MDWLTRNDNEHFLLFQKSKAKIDPYINLKIYITLYTNKTQPIVSGNTDMCLKIVITKISAYFCWRLDEKKNIAVIDKAISYED